MSKDDVVTALKGYVPCPVCIEDAPTCHTCKGRGTITIDENLSCYEVYSSLFGVEYSEVRGNCSKCAVTVASTPKVHDLDINCMYNTPIVVDDHE